MPPHCLGWPELENGLDFRHCLQHLMEHGRSESSSHFQRPLPVSDTEHRCGVFLESRVAGLYSPPVNNTSKVRWSNHCRRRFISRICFRDNHHAQLQSPRHGLAWYEFDMYWYGIAALRLANLAWDLKLPPSNLTAKANDVGFHTRKVHFGRIPSSDTTNSTLRFLCPPEALSVDSSGTALPNPRVCTESFATPCCRR